MSIYPGPQPVPPAPQTSTRKPWWKRWWGITLIVLAALVVIGNLAPDTPEDTSASEPIKTTTAQDVAATEPTVASTPVTATEPPAPSPSPSSTPTPSPSPTPSPTPTEGPWETFDAEVNALTACELRGEAMYPYGFKVHSILGKMADDVTPDEQGRFLKYEVTITNVFNAERKGTMECTVGGDPSSPSVTDFLVY